MHLIQIHRTIYIYTQEFYATECKLEKCRGSTSTGQRYQNYSILSYCHTSGTKKNCGGERSIPGLQITSMRNF